MTRERYPDDIIVPIPTRPEFKAINIRDFLAHEFPEREFLLEPIIPSQGLAMIYAQTGVGKTQVALHIAHAVASGGSLFHWSAPKSRRALFIDGEMAGAVLQERLAAIVAASQEAECNPENLQILTNDLQESALPDLATLKGQIELEPFTSEADLIIVDNISTLFRTGAENRSEDWAISQEWALRMRAQGRSVLFIHHAGKGGAQRGTSKREDILDTVINLKRPVDYEPSEGAKFEVHYGKARGLYGDDVKPFVAELSTGKDKDSKDITLWTTKWLDKSTREKVAALYNEGLKQNEITLELGINKSNVSRHMKTAREEGLIHEKNA